VLALILIMVFFQVTTSGTLFKPVNLTNLVLQNSYIIIMALGMLLVIISGHIDLSVGSDSCPAVVIHGVVGPLVASHKPLQACRPKTLRTPDWRHRRR